MTTRKLALYLVAASCLPLIVMAIIGFTTGATQEAYEYAIDPALYGKRIVEQANGVRMVFAFDVAFIVFYTGFFAAFADYLRKIGAPFVTLALVALLATSFLDIVEDHHILAMLGKAEAGFALDADSLVFQQTLSSTKFTVSYVSLFLFGLAIPRTTKLGWGLALFLTIGNLASGVLGYAAPPAWRSQLDGGRWIGFLVGFAIAGLWLRQAPEPEASR